MHGELVALDLETTGFDPRLDAIIEVGLVRMRDGVILEELGLLVNPGRSIPAAVMQLTGIRTEDVVGKPTIEKVLPDLRVFIGDRPIIGHNVSFDVGFLQQQGLGQSNLHVDTYELAAFLLPRTPRYALGNLASVFDLPLAHAHRALDDARATALLYWQLWERLLKLPRPLIEELSRHANGLEWLASPALHAALAEPGSHESGHIPPTETGTRKTPEPARRPSSPATTIDGIFADDGPVAAQFEQYEARPQQIEMARLVERNLQDGGQRMIEAGTGSGKSLAYLVPAAMWATARQERVVISTHSIHLQDQLLNHDIPIVEAALGLDVGASVLKGRSNYLCPRRLSILREQEPQHIDELRVLAKVLVWSHEGSSGDRSDLTLRGPGEFAAWSRLSAADEHCTTQRCESMMAGQCPFHRARQQAEAARLLIVNHALLATDTAEDEGVLPEFHHLIVDEAHHLDSATTSGLTMRIDEVGLQRRIQELSRPTNSFLSSLLRVLSGHLPEREQERIANFINSIRAATGPMESHTRAFFGALRAYYQVLERESNGDYLPSARLTPPMRDKTNFDPVRESYRTLSEFFDVIGGKLDQLAAYLTKQQEKNLPNFDHLLNGTRSIGRTLRETGANLTEAILSPASERIYWLSAGQNGSNMAVHLAPLEPGAILQQRLWSRMRSVTLTSATLTVEHSFEFIQQQLHTEQFQTSELGSPFDYKQSTLVYIPEKFPEPNERNAYQQALEKGIIELAAALNGRVMVLFTSYAQLQQTSQAITPRLALGNIAVYDQLDASNREGLTNGFKKNERAVLLGTRSFWEGVDIPGESLSALVITRLPFAVPNEPIFAARSERYGDPFREYSVPDAVLRFRQGFGRLIRTRTDRGIVAIFDNRIISKGYGKQFLASLPDCTVQKGRLENLPAAAVAWLGKT
jgi:DNA polymerase-3 subunit epsilon/ATP-dependent DNA helicase DinG